MQSGRSIAERRARTSRLWRTVAMTLCAGLSMAGLSSSSDSSDKDVTPPTLVLPESVPWGGALYGTAFDRSTPLYVSATSLGGAPLPGSPDSTSAAGANAFCFPVPRGSGVGQIRIVATDSEGNTRVAFVPIR
jgi:hypothetical protein